jgi:hypothetical protein
VRPKAERRTELQPLPAFRLGRIERRSKPHRGAGTGVKKKKYEDLLEPLELELNNVAR